MYVVEILGSYLGNRGLPVKTVKKARKYNNIQIAKEVAYITGGRVIKL